MSGHAVVSERIVDLLVGQSRRVPQVGKLSYEIGVDFRYHRMVDVVAESEQIAVGVSQLFCDDDPFRRGEESAHRLFVR